MTEALDGFLYGCTSTGSTGRELFRLARDGSSYTIVHAFPSTDGLPLTPIAIVRGTDQYLYGLTDKDGSGGRGTLFRVNADGSGFVVLRDFATGPARGTGRRSEVALCRNPMARFMDSLGNKAAAVPACSVSGRAMAALSGCTRSIARVSPIMEPF